jgi:hypothetical protein
VSNWTIALAAAIFLAMLAASGLRLKITPKPRSLSRAWQEQHAARPCMKCESRIGSVLHVCGEVGMKDGRVIRWHWNLG